MTKHYQVTTSIVQPPVPERISDHFTDDVLDAIKEHAAATKDLDLSDGKRRTITWKELPLKAPEKSNG